MGANSKDAASVSTSTGATLYCGARAKQWNICSLTKHGFTQAERGALLWATGLDRFTDQTTLGLFNAYVPFARFIITWGLMC